MTNVLLTDYFDSVAVLTLNRPDRLNAISYELADAILAELDRIELDPSVRAVILTGAGERAFSAGGDIFQFSETVKEGKSAAVQAFVRRGQALTGRLEAYKKPLIAAVNGLAYGGGCEITEAVHLAIASESAVFAKPEVKLAMPPTFGGTQRLTRQAGRKRALELLLTGRPFSAREAQALGLINQVVPPADLLDSALTLADTITRHSPSSVASIITAVTRGINLPIAEGLLVESEQFEALVGSYDLEEGLTAWKERRDPIFTGI